MNKVLDPDKVALAVEILQSERDVLISAAQKIDQQIAGLKALAETPAPAPRPHKTPSLPPERVPSKLVGRIRQMDQQVLDAVRRVVNDGERANCESVGRLTGFGRTKVYERFARLVSAGLLIKHGSTKAAYWIPTENPQATPRRRPAPPTIKTRLKITPVTPKAKPLPEEPWRARPGMCAIPTCRYTAQPGTDLCATHNAARLERLPRSRRGTWSLPHPQGNY